MPPESKATAFVFPGQGSQVIGMGKRLTESNARSAEVFAEADDILGFPISQICWEGPEDVLNDTINSQPALLTHSIAVLRAFEDAYPGTLPAYTAGHSLGEYSALVCVGSLSYPDALRLVRARGEAMKQAGEAEPGGMAAVLGLDAAMVERACMEARQESDEPIQVANDNCPGQIVISGSEAGLVAAMERLKTLGARRVIRLAVSIAGHSPLMREAQERFVHVLDETDFKIPSIPIVGNVSARPLQTVQDIRDELYAQLTSQVRWTETIRWMIDRGSERFLEFGPKDVLTKLINRIDGDVEATPLAENESIAAFGTLSEA